MPKISETQLYNMVSRELLHICRDDLKISEECIHICRVESGWSCPGIPDINVCIKGIEFWIECKISNMAGSRNQLKPMQKSWAKHRTLAGGKVFVLRYNSIHDRFTLVNCEVLVTTGSLRNVLEALLFEVSKEEV